MDHIVFKYFKEISEIPRGSGNCKAISDYLVSFAKEKGLKVRQDEALNVVIFKPASEGYEDHPTVILQGHMDMVCERLSDSNHDFLTEGLELKVDGDYLYAEGTTLGGDDGAAVAYAMAILADDTIPHPALEVIITTDEEIGLLGATALDTSDLKGTYMINMDSEEEDILLASCAGGVTAKLNIPLTYEKQEGKKLSITVKGLQGGHSGAEIHKHRINATKLLGRLLYDLRKFSFQVISMHGGLMDNAIPREAVAEIITSDNEAYAIINEIKFLNEKYRNECRSTEPDLTVEVKQGEEKSYSVMSHKCFEKILLFLMESLNGVQTMSADIEGLVESSLNLGIFFTDEEKAEFGYSVRSSVSSYKSYMIDQLEFLITRLGGTIELSGDYPGWEFKKESKLRGIYADAFREVTGKEISIEAIHAGLECGILAEKLGDIDIISIGPNMKDIHTTEERLSISSTKTVYEVILNTLKEI